MTRHQAGKKKLYVLKQTQRPFSLRRADRQEKQKEFVDLAKLELNVWNMRWKMTNVSEFGEDSPKENDVACADLKRSN
jgi:hypothetical protein